MHTLRLSAAAGLVDVEIRETNRVHARAFAAIIRARKPQHASWTQPGETMLPDEVAVRPLTERHWLEVREIYARGIATGNATFDDQPPTWE